jgi:hypothetical protein
MEEHAGLCHPAEVFDHFSRRVAGSDDPTTSKGGLVAEGEFRMKVPRGASLRILQTGNLDSHACEAERPRSEVFAAFFLRQSTAMVSSRPYPKRVQKDSIPPVGVPAGVDRRRCAPDGLSQSTRKP